MAQYKDIIREQDLRLQTVRDELKRKHDEADVQRKQLLDAQQSNTQLFDQNILLKAQLAAAIGNGTATSHQQPQPVSHSTQISFYEAENARLAREVAELNDKFAETKLETTETEEVSTIRKEQEDLLELLSDQVRGVNAVTQKQIVLHYTNAVFLSHSGIENRQISAAIVGAWRGTQRRRG